MFENLSVWSLALNVLVLIVSVSGFIKIMNNDLSHLKNSVADVKNTLNEHGKKIDNVAERIASMEGAFSVSIKRGRGKKKK
jgi:hypothetical protein